MPPGGDPELDDDVPLQDSKASCKIVSNSKGHNVSVHVFEGADKAVVDNVVNLAVAGWKKAVKDAQQAERELAEEAGMS